MKPFLKFLVPLLLFYIGTGAIAQSKKPKNILVILSDDHALETTLMGHPEDVIPFVVANYTVKDASGKLLKEVKGNYQAINTIELDEAISTDALVFEFSKKERHIPVSLFKISAYN
ncbi:hypothetical protein Q4603_13690 [Zobellia galactanivorans]|uniref:hypothetical protein n=1 Tax=Zobellia galactanivorans (strain DSM 12802 / CCUG 47099 / CIP 106680 / NCIMB 13871 / Dsij) TaxID=63186 RepID=UPI0026E32709|nr:hypothetical protein [Zobellia galactanivorans]MDO6809673.1 hypothetical protein [Zobellia galactanivorans]